MQFAALLFSGHYLYVGYLNGETTDFSGASLRSPTFPPPPKYNNNASSPFYRSCRVKSYFTIDFLMHNTYTAYIPCTLHFSGAFILQRQSGFVPQSIRSDGDVL